MIESDVWSACYGEGWGKLLTGPSYAHPAKFSKKLIFKIVQHALEEGFIHPGETVIDPFAGASLGALPCALYGIPWVGVELEDRFCAIAHGCECAGDGDKHAACIDDQEHTPHHITGNLELWQRRYGHLPQWVPPIVLQGDSRFLQEALAAADLSICSPPYANGCVHDTGQPPDRVRQGSGTLKRPWGTRKHGDALSSYGPHPDNIANLPPGAFDSLIASPAYGGNEKSDYLLSTDGKTRCRDERRGYSQGHGCFRGSETYGESPGQLGRESPTTFWEAAATILQQVYTVLKAGGHAIWVTKNFIRDSLIVPFNDQWRTLCEHIGFRTLHIHHAMQVEHHAEVGLFGEQVTMYHKEHKGHFRRQNEAKGAPRIDYEQVLCLVKDGDGDDVGINASISSSPYAGAGEVLGTHNGIDWSKAKSGGRRRTAAREASGLSYGSTPGNLGALPTGAPYSKEII